MRWQHLTSEQEFIPCLSFAFLMSDNDNVVEVEGKIIAVLPNDVPVELPNGHQVLGHISGKLRKHFIRRHGKDGDESARH